MSTERIKELLTAGCPACGQKEGFRIYSVEKVHRWVKLYGQEIDWGPAEFLETSNRAIMCLDCCWEEDFV